MKKLLLALLLSTSAFADVSLKAFTENDFGVEYQLGSGVVGVDLEKGLPVFIMGAEKRMRDIDLLFFTGFGFRERTRTTYTTSSAFVSEKGCEKGKGKGVKRNCEKQNNGGSFGGSSSGNGGSSNNPSTGNTSPSTGTSLTSVTDEELFQKVGVRATAKIFDNLNPSVEVNLATPDMGISIDTSVQLGLVLRF